MKAGKKKQPAATDEGKLVRKVHLQDEDWARIHWRGLPPVHRVGRTPFDPAATLREVKKFTKDWKRFFLSDLPVPFCVGREEAWFWSQIYLTFGGDSHLTDRDVEEFEKHLFQPLPTDTEIRARIKGGLYRRIIHHALQILVPFFTPLEIAEMILGPTTDNEGTSRLYGYDMDIFLRFHELILNPMPLAAREELSGALNRRYQAILENPQSESGFIALYLAVIPRGRRLQEYVAGQSENSWVNGWGGKITLETLVNLEDEASFVAETRRLGCKVQALHNDVSILRCRLWLAATEWRELDLLTSAVITASHKNMAQQFAQILALVEAPENARGMLEVKLKSKAPMVALRWLEKYPLHAAVGLVPVAMEEGPLKSAAREHLAGMRDKETASALTLACSHLTEEQSAWLRREIIEAKGDTPAPLDRPPLPEALSEVLKEIKVTPAPLWLSVAGLPPILVDGQPLPGSETERVISGLKKASAGITPPLIPALKTHGDSLSLEAFAWSLFEQWLGSGATPQDKWTLRAVGFFGGDASVLKLSPLIRAWPGESQHQLAVLGLETLRRIGSDGALSALNEISKKVKFPGLKKKAQTMMAEIAEERGLSQDQLNDRIVSHFGLDARGRRLLDFGPRQFHFVLGPSLAPRVADATGKIQAGLPAARSSDDAQKAEATAKEWAFLKKAVAEVVKVQANRLEQAMVTGRRWQREEFQNFLVHHPLMFNLARQLLWTTMLDGSIKTFRVTEERTFADQNDDALELPPESEISVAHPVDLDDSTRMAWGQLMSDYKLISPFPQVGRPFHRPLPEEQEQTEITRFAELKLDGTSLSAILGRSGFKHETSSMFCKFHPYADITAYLSVTWQDYPGCKLSRIYFQTGPLASQENSEKTMPPLAEAVNGEMTLEEAKNHLRKLLFPDPSQESPPSEQKQTHLKIKDVPPVVFSETLRMALAVTLSRGSH